jgi:hypothetical protein
VESEEVESEEVESEEVESEEVESKEVESKEIKKEVKAIKKKSNNDCDVLMRIKKTFIIVL